MTPILKVLWALRMGSKTVKRAGTKALLNETIDLVDEAVDLVEDAIKSSNYFDELYKKAYEGLVPVDDVATQAAAYGWEIGKGQDFAPVLHASSDNPFLDRDWRTKFVDPKEYTRMIKTYKEGRNG